MTFAYSQLFHNVSAAHALPRTRGSLSFTTSSACDNNNARVYRHAAFARTLPLVPLRTYRTMPFAGRLNSLSNHALRLPVARAAADQNRTRFAVFGVRDIFVTV